jgi:hypothetical protein
MEEQLAYSLYAVSQEFWTEHIQYANDTMVMPPTKIIMQHVIGINE